MNSELPTDVHSSTPSVRGLSIWEVAMSTHVFQAGSGGCNVEHILARTRCISGRPHVGAALPNLPLCLPLSVP
jgi:hypothetical protein